MSRSKHIAGLAAVASALLIGLPSIGQAQQAQPVYQCKSAYSNCIKTKNFDDAGGKLACAEDYKRCLTAADKAGSARIPWNAQAATKKSPQ